MRLREEVACDVVRAGGREDGIGNVASVDRHDAAASYSKNQFPGSVPGRIHFVNVNGYECAAYPVFRWMDRIDHGPIIGPIRKLSPQFACGVPIT